MLLDGKKIKSVILDEVKEKVSELSLNLKLVVIQAGEFDANDIYIKQKRDMCNYVGYDFEHIKLGNEVTTLDVVSLIEKLNNDKSVHGILVQLPLPREIDTDKVVNAISPLKDVDGLTDYNSSLLYHNRDCFCSCTALGIVELLDRYNISFEGKHVVIVNRSKHIGKPLSMLLLNRDATVTVCHSKTNNLSNITKSADILVVGVGIPNFITSDMISEDVIIIDVGINNELGLICGDVNYLLVKDKVKYITPVPGGVGPMTVAMLAKNMLKTYKSDN